MEKLLDILHRTASLLEANGVEDSRLNAELILCEVLKYERLNLYLNFEQPLKESEIEKVNQMVYRRLKKEPLQYIIGHTNFYGYRIFLSPDVLIPRPETEILVEKILEFIKHSNKKNLHIVEAGTGSGCIVVAIAGELEKLGFEYNIYAMDSSDAALKLARNNIIVNNLNSDKIRFQKVDVLKMESIPDACDIFVSNPPYISFKEFLHLSEEIKLYEPEQALTDGADGLTFYRKFFSLLRDKHNIIGFFEIGATQKPFLMEILNTAGIKNFYFYKDYNNLDRVLKIEL
ncbi:MAG: peptide chain release factor N(5)-glutamine methyltransferase [Ignavibacteria bacterium]